MPETPRPTVLAGFAGMVVLIGLNFVAVRASNEELAPTWGAAARFGVASALLLAIVRARGIPLPRGRALVGAVLYGAVFFAVFFGFIYWGLVAVPAAVASIINASVPLLTFVAAVAVGLERFHWRALLGALVVIAGIAILVGSDAARAAPPLRLAAVVVACTGAALGAVVVKWFPRSHPLATNAVGMSVAFAILLAVSLLRREPWALPTRTGTWLAVAFLVGSSLVLFPLFVWVVGEWTASASAYSVVLAPLVTVPAAALLLDEGVGAGFFLAALVILAGVCLGVLWPERRDRGAGA